MKKAVSVLMALVMVALCFALFSCSNSGKSDAEASGGAGTTDSGDPKIYASKRAELSDVVGTWSMRINGEKLLFAGGDTSGAQWSGDIKVSLAFYEEGRLVVGLNKSETREFIKNNFEAAVAMYDLSVDELMEEGHYESEDEAIDSMLDSFTYLNKNGTFTISNGVMTTELISTTHTHSHGHDEEEEALSEIRVDVRGDTLIFREYVEEGGDNAMFNPVLLPLEFKKSGA